MDDRSIEKLMSRRERQYIWLERKLKQNLVVTSFAVSVCFLIIFGILKWEFPAVLWGVYAAALAANAVWCYGIYRREYKNYQEIAAYLDAFENGDYGFGNGLEDMKAGVHSQILEQLERLGRAFSVMKNEIVREKKETEELVTDITHQIKTPIAALGMSLELMEDTDTTAEEKREFLGRAREEVRKLNYLTGTLANLSRMERAMIQLKPEHASLKKTLLRAVNGVYLKAAERDVEIELEEFEDQKLFHDVKWTAEAFSNVLDNAVKYSPAGSTVKIRVESYISYVAMEVEDEGIGIEKAECTEIFKRFYRGKRAETWAAEGAGVGLYLVRKILEGQGGSVCVSRNITKTSGGSVFRLTLPKE